MPITACWRQGEPKLKQTLRIHHRLAGSNVEFNHPPSVFLNKASIDCACIHRRNKLLILAQEPLVRVIHALHASLWVLSIRSNT